MNAQNDTYPLDQTFPIHVNQVWMKGYHQAQEHFHWHSFYEISYVMEGGGVCVVNGKSHPVQQGDLAIFNRDEIHGWRMPEDDIRLLVVAFLPSVLTGLENGGPDSLQAFRGEGAQFRNVLCRGEPMVEEIAAGLWAVWREWEGREQGRTLMIRAELLRVLVMLERSFLAPKLGREQQQYQRDLRKIRSALLYLDAHYKEKITLEQVAGAAYLNKTYFSTLFHKVMKQRFREYLLAKRLATARQLLEEKDMSVLQAATECGFESMSNFYRQYRRYYGERPRGCAK